MPTRAPVWFSYPKMSSDRHLSLANAHLRAANDT
nr:MAG TPA: hypothetical protein [Caudoviricetes sp.]